LWFKSYKKKFQTYWNFPELSMNGCCVGFRRPIGFLPLSRIPHCLRIQLWASVGTSLICFHEISSKETEAHLSSRNLQTSSNFPSILTAWIVYFLTSNLPFCCVASVSPESSSSCARCLIKGQALGCTQQLYRICNFIGVEEWCLLGCYAVWLL
jgi:hypothetical protein